MIYSCTEKTWVAGEFLHNNNHYLEIIYPTLFEKGKARLFQHAHPDSLSRDHLLKYQQFDKIEEIEEIKEVLKQL